GPRMPLGVGGDRIGGGEGRPGGDAPATVGRRSRQAAPLERRGSPARDGRTALLLPGPGDPTLAAGHVARAGGRPARSSSLSPTRLNGSGIYCPAGAGERDDLRPATCFAYVDEAPRPFPGRAVDPR